MNVRSSLRASQLALFSLLCVGACAADQSAQAPEDLAAASGASAAPAMAAASTPGASTTSTAPTAPNASSASAGRSSAAPVASGAAGAAAMVTTPATSATAGAGSAEFPADDISAAGAAAAAGSGATMEGAPAAGSMAEVPREDLGMGDGSDVIAIGDSWMLLGATGIQLSLVRLSGQPYRTYGVPGTRLLDEVIPNQYASAKRANPDIKTVVMTGGGNDLLLTGAGNDRAEAGPNTRMQIDKVADRLVELWDEMGADGVKDVVYIEYSRGGESEKAIEYATEKIRPLCEAATPARCHWVDSDLYIMKVLLDGIHPTGDGCDKIAQGVIDMMEQEGMRR